MGELIRRDNRGLAASGQDELPGFDDMLAEILGQSDGGMFAPDQDTLGGLLTVDDVLDKLQCEQSLEEFCKRTWDLISDKPLVMSPHITLLCRHLEAVSHKQIARLLVNIPPGLTKSTLIGVMWPAWTWTWYPEARFFFFAYHQDLVKRDSTLCKKILRSEWYQRFWGEKTAAAEDDTKMFYRNVAGGWRRASVIRGLGTGEHPDFLGIDDPLSREEAKSETGRYECKRWYFETMSSRGMTREVAHVVSAQRLDEDDLPGAILEQIKLDEGTEFEGRWHQIMLPMHFDPARAMPDRGYGGDWRTKPGELLAPKILSAKQVALLVRDLQTSDPSAPAAQLEQNPKKLSGDMFKIDRLKKITRAEVPKLERVYRFWDRASSPGRGCNTAGVLLGIRGEMVFILDCVAGQWSVDDVYRHMMTSAIIDEDRYGGVECVEIGVEQEPGSGGVEAAENAIKRLKGHRVTCKSPSTNKEARAQPAANAIAFGEVYIVTDEPWYAPFLEELRKFPNGRKDRVDALSGAYLGLLGGIGPKRRGTVVNGVTGIGKTMCIAKGCMRPATSDEQYCCKECELIASFEDGTTCSDHCPTCNQRNFDFHNKV